MNQSDPVGDPANRGNAANTVVDEGVEQAVEAVGRSLSEGDKEAMLAAVAPLPELQDEACLSLNLPARCEQAWRTPEGTYLVPKAFAPVQDSYGNPIVRVDGTILSVAITYAELTSTGEVRQVYGGAFHYYAPEETLITGIFAIVGGALHQYEWYEQDRPAPGSLTDVVVREGLVAE